MWPKKTNGYFFRRAVRATAKYASMEWNKITTQQAKYVLGTFAAQLSVATSVVEG